MNHVAAVDEATAASPVSEAEHDGRAPADGIALCLSGGGYRAMLFHVGALWRLNELRFLPRLDRVSSVSGGSITAATLALNWSELAFAGDVARAFEDRLVTPVRRLASETIDRGSILGGLITPRRSIADKVAGAYATHLFGSATLQALPDRPRFVINATNVLTGSLWRFSKPYMADHRIGRFRDPEVPLAVAVAASSAFPPVLSPLRLAVDPARLDETGRGPLAVAPYTREAVLTDGGVYDNLGLETAWKRYKTVLVSDGGGQMEPEPEAHADWARHAIRINAVIDSQVRSLRKRLTIAGYERGDHTGAYWGIRGDIGRYAPPGGGLPCPPERTALLAATKTRLQSLPDDLQERLINWGYAVCDAAMRTHVAPDAAPPAGFPYPERGVG